MAFLVGVPIAGITFAEAKKFEDAGRGWLLTMVGRNWGNDVALCVQSGGVSIDK